jgi:2-hydroxychromene-2-carboxylate isomerase
MPKPIDYFVTPVSPWTCLGHDRLIHICRGEFFPGQDRLDFLDRALA